MSPGGSSGPVVVLIGAPGSGKSSVGARVAEKLAVPFRDTDADIEASVGKSIADIFVDDGEAAFRALERSAVSTALREHDGVLALGGGAVLDDGTRSALRPHRVVWLQVGLADAVKRVGLARERPVIALNPRATLAKLLDERAPLYAAVATETVPTDGRDLDAVVADVLEVVERA